MNPSEFNDVDLHKLLQYLANDNKQIVLMGDFNFDMLNMQKKSHTCEEGGAHLRISFWHLLMNLKNK